MNFSSFSAPAPRVPTATSNEPVWLRVGTVIEGTLDTPLRDVHVVYDAEGIRFVGPANAWPSRDILRHNQHSPDLDAPDCTLLPGLIEAHAHLFLEGGELDLEKRAAYLQQSPDALFTCAHERLHAILACGITAVRDAGDKNGVGLALSRLDQAGRAERPFMPYLDSPGAAIHHQGRYGSFMGEPLEAHLSPADCVAARVEAGADRLKLISTGIINFERGLVTSKPQMDTTEVRALVRAAQAFGKQTFAHASGDDGIEHAIEGGVDTVEHGFFIREDQLARMRDRDIGWVPTFAPVQRQVDHAARFGWSPEIVANLQRILDQHAASLVKAHAMGVRIIAGSDAGSCGVAHALDFLYELELMERAGLPPLAVINAATGRSAERLAFRSRFGRIAQGYQSRFLLTRANPLKTVSALRDPLAVVFDGKMVPHVDPASSPL